MRVKISGKGLDAMIRELDHAASHEFSTELKQHLDRAVASTTEHMREVAPVRSGRLKASGTWSSAAEADAYVAEIQFGGETAPYAQWALRSGTNGTRMDSAFAMGENAVDEAISEAFPF